MKLFGRSQAAAPGKYDLEWGHSVSPDGRRKAFRARCGRDFFVVVDGVPGKAYEDSGVNPPVFSPDSSRIAFSMKRHGRQFIVLDGKEGPMLDEIVDGPARLPAGAGTAGLRGQSGIVFSPDSRHLAYAGWIGKDAVVVVDGTIGEPYDQIGMIGIFFSADSRHVAYAAGKGSQWFVVIDGKSDYAYEGIGQDGLSFVVDDTAVSFKALLNGEWRTVKQPFR